MKKLKLHLNDGTYAINTTGNDKTSQEPDQKNKCCEKCKPLEHIPPNNCPIDWKHAGSLELRCERCKQLIKATEYKEYVRAVIN